MDETSPPSSCDDTTHLLADCLEAAARGDTAAVQAFRRGHPHLAARLDAALEANRALDSIRPALAGELSAGARPGERIDRFEVLERIGRGGVGVVYRVRDTYLGRELALKTLAGGHLASIESRERFRREMATLARLQHPNILSVHEVFQGVDGVPWFTMDLVDGCSLDTLLRRAAASGQGQGASLELGARGDTRRARVEESHAKAVARLLAKVADALEQAHRAGVLHRDVKPGNILVDARGEPHLIDFGIARTESDATLTLQGMAPGTPLYMAPEQVGGRHAELGPGVDVYALGSVLYECLTLRTPFDGRTTYEILDRIRTQAPRPPRRLDPRIPRDLETICLKALEKSATRRYPTAAALRDDLEAFVSDRPIQARRASPWTRTVLWSRRSPTRALAAALVVLAAMGYCALSSASYQHLKAGRGHLAVFHERLLERIGVAQSLLRDEPLLARHLPEEKRGRIWHDRTRLKELEADCISLLRLADEELGKVGFVLGPWNMRAEQLRSWVADQGEWERRWSGDVARLASREALSGGSGGATPAPVTIAALPVDASAHLFRFEPYEELPGRKARVPRLVPVPVEPAGDPVSFQDLAGFQPGDRCLVVKAVSPDGRAAREGVRPGDLVLRIDGVPATEGVFVSEVHPGGAADEAGVRPLDRLVRLSWLADPLGDAEAHPVARVAAWGRVGPVEGDVKAVILTASGERTIAVDTTAYTLAQRANEPWWGGPFIPTRARWEYLPERMRQDTPCMEDLFGMSVSSPECALGTLAPSRLMVLTLLRGGEYEQLWLSAGEIVGLECEETAYPLVCSEWNAVAGRPVVLPPGSYLLLVRAQGCCEVRVPFVVDSSPVSLELDLPRQEVVPPGFVYVLGGSFLFQGDPEVPFPLELKEEHLTSFFISRHEVTVGEWWEFLASSGQIRPVEDGPAVVDYPVPKKPPSRDSPAWDSACWEVIRPRPDERLPLPSRVEPDSPVVGITQKAAESYVRWRNELAAVRGEPWVFSLASQTQWEKAARGVDGRTFVWGDEFDFSLAYSLPSDLAGSPHGYKLDPVGSYPTDESVYGVRDLAGSATEWNGDPIFDGGNWRAVRGGSWVSTTPQDFRCANRSGSAGDLPERGLRLVAVPRQRDHGR